MCKAQWDNGGRRCPCSGGTMPAPRTRQERQERAKFLASKRNLNRSAAGAYRERQAVMTAEARELINSLDRVPADQRAAALTAALEDLPPRGAIQPRRVLEEALAKSPVSVPVSAQPAADQQVSTSPPITPVPVSVPVTAGRKESKALTAARQRLELATAAGASPESLAIIQRRIDTLTPKPRAKQPQKPAQEPVQAQPTAPKPAAPSWTPESARDAVEQVVQAEFDKGRSADEIQQLMWQQMSTLSPSKDRVMFSALNAAMRELEAYR